MKKNLKTRHTSKKKHESKKARKNRAEGHGKMYYYPHNQNVLDKPMPRTFEEAVAMGILK